MPERPLVRYALEAIVIVASILVAFAIDAWWEERAEARARAALLSALRSDTDAMRREVERVRDALRASRDGAADFLQLDRETLGPEDAERVDRIAFSIFRGPSFDAPLGAAQALLAGGDLSYVDNQALVDRVTALLGDIADLDREQRRIPEAHIRLRRAMNDDGVDTSHILGRGGAYLGQENPARSRATELWRHASDPRIRSETGFIWGRNVACMFLLGRIEEHLDALAVMLE